MKRLIILLLMVLLVFDLMVSCGGSKKPDETTVEEHEIIFHDIQLSLPEEYIYDENSTDDQATYKVSDEEGYVHKMVMLQFMYDVDADFSNSENVSSYEKELIDGDTFYNGSGMEKVAIDEDLYAYETSCKYDGDLGTNDVEIMAFNDSDHNLYSIFVVTDDGSSRERMQSINDSLRYSFSVADETEANKQDESAESGYYFKDNVIKTSDRTIKIKKYEVIQPGKNPYSSIWVEKEPVIAFWYEVTNDSDENIQMATSWEWAVECIQDNSDDYENTLEVALAPDDSLTKNYLKEIKPGGTLECAMAYKLTDETTPVTLIAKNGLLGEELGRKDYKIK